jgi:peptidoglycan/LPS O-acetylase OafA/YrhL
MDANLQNLNQSIRIPSLDGLRGIAILLVIAYHYFGFIGIFSLGWSGVDLFFVLSGFLITGKLLDTADNKDYFPHFFRNRILRIFPLYYLTLILFFSAVFLIATKEHWEALRFYREHWLSFFTFTQNWSLIFFGSPGDKYLTHFWSLAAEEQFYIVWPFVIYFIRNKKKLFTILLTCIPLIIVVRSYIYIQYPSHAEAPHYYCNSFCRMDSFIFGALISIAGRTGLRITLKIVRILFLTSLVLIGIGILASGSAGLSNPFFATIGYSLIGIFYAFLLYISIQPKTFLSKLFTAPFLRFCGKISYGLYIFHVPVRLILGSRLYNWMQAIFPRNPTLVLFISLSFCLLMTFVISIISFNYFESYFLRLKK